MRTMPKGRIPVPAQSTEPPAPQPAVSPLTAAAVFLVLTISPGGEDAVRDLLPDLSGIGRSVGFRIPEAELQVVSGDRLGRVGPAVRGAAAARAASLPRAHGGAARGPGDPR